MPSKLGAVVLAAGKGTRLGCVDSPKVMLEIGGRPIVSYTVETLFEIGFTHDKICLVVGFQKEKVKEYFGDKVVYADQTEQLGTAHAAYTGIRALPTEVEEVLVLGGDDSAFYQPGTLYEFMDEHLKSGAVLSMLSAEVENPTVGRIVRGEKGIEVVEKEYLTDEQKKIKEISTGTYCINRKWFEEVFPQMPQLRKLGEWGLPTALALARESGQKFIVKKLRDSREWFGVNTPEELQLANELKSKL